MSVLAVAVALGVDRAWGEPPLRWHPVVWVGQYLMWMGERIAPPATPAPAASATSVAPADWGAFGLGVAAWMGGAAFFVSLAWGLQNSLLGLGVADAAGQPAWGWLGQVGAAVGMGLLLKPMLAWRMLEQEVQAVEAALQTSLEQGRERLSWICSRDTHSLNEAQVRETAIESLAENLNDSVIAPLCWFVALGLPGAVLYRFANTADAMWGYRGEREGRVWEWAGKWAARADDVLSWVPARITAALLLVGARHRAFSALARQACKTPSPNSGWPMAAMALALNVRLAKPGVYTLHSKGRRAGPLDTRRAARLGTQVVLAMVPVVAGLQLLVLVVVAWVHA